MSRIKSLPGGEFWPSSTDLPLSPGALQLGTSSLADHLALEFRKAADHLIIIRPAGIIVSMASVRDWKPALLASIFSMMRSGVEPPVSAWSSGGPSRWALRAGPAHTAQSLKCRIDIERLVVGVAIDEWRRLVGQHLAKDGGDQLAFGEPLLETEADSGREHAIRDIRNEAWIPSASTFCPNTIMLISIMSELRRGTHLLASRYSSRSRPYRT